MDIKANDQVIIDYGDSAQPSWRCLASYRFIPECYREDDVAKVYVHGRCFEVGPSTIPVDLVATASTVNGCVLEEEPMLTPHIALSIAHHLSEGAFQLLQDPEEFLEEDDLDDEKMDEDEHQTAEAIILTRLADSLC